jgi:hypothetical protein
MIPGSTGEGRQDTSQEALEKVLRRAARTCN